MALVKHRNSGRYHAPSETSKIRLGPAFSLRVIRIGFGQTPANSGLPR